MDKICNRILGRGRGEESDFMKRIVTVDEIYTPKTKQQSTMFCKLVDTAVQKVYHAQSRFKKKSWFTLPC